MSRVTCNVEMAAVGQFLIKAAVAFQGKQGHILSELLLPDLSNPDIEQITEELLLVRQTLIPTRVYKVVKQWSRPP